MSNMSNADRARLAATGYTRNPEHLRLWNENEATNPGITKEFPGRGGFKGTAIAPTHVMKRLTMAFGPVGWGWGYEVKRTEVITGGPVRDHNGELLGHEAVQVTYVGFWYYPGGRTVENTHPGYEPARFDQVGQTTVVAYRAARDEGRGPAREASWATDEEAWKKSLTDALTKAASHIGIGADVHLGMFDDSKYVNQRINAVEDEAEAEAKAAAEAAKRGEAQAQTAKAADLVALMEAVSTMTGELRAVQSEAALAVLRGKAMELRVRLEAKGEKGTIQAIGTEIAAACKRLGVAPPRSRGRGAAPAEGEAPARTAAANDRLH